MTERRRLAAETTSLSKVLRRAYTRLGVGSGRLAAASVAGSVLRSLLVLPVAFILRRLLDHALPARDSGALIRGAAVLLLLFATGALVAAVTRRTVLVLTQDALERVRVLMLEKLYALPRTFFSSVVDSDIHSLVIQDSARLETVLATSVAAVLPALVVGAAVAVVAVVLQPTLFLLVALTLPVNVAIGRVIVRRVHELAVRWQGTVDRYSADITRGLRAMTLTAVMGAEGVEIARQRRTIGELRDGALALSRAQTSGQAVLGVCSALGSAVLVTAGAVRVADGHLSGGSLLGFYAVMAVLTQQISIVLGSLPSMAAAAASYERIEALLDAADAPPYAGTRRHRCEGELELEAVTFGYDDTPLLDDVSLHVRPGEHVVILGPNGAGKTTLTLLLLGLYRPQGGRLLLDGVPYHEIDLQDLHRACGVVLQDPVILPGSIRDAIGYGREELPPGEVARVAALVGLDGFVATLDAGYDTLVGDEGARLSGGQRQRLSLARALVGAPRILVLDEPTNHLDDAAVVELLAALRSLDPQPTIVTITHDLTLAAHGDKVLELRGGRLRTSSFSA